MHPVIKHLLARKNKAVPINDGRKIALVLFGGTMRGIRGTGTLIALEELGLRNAFDEIYCASASFPTAAFFLSGQEKYFAPMYYNDLASENFIKKSWLWKTIDLDFATRMIRKKYILDIDELLRQQTRLYGRVAKFPKRELLYREVHEVGREHVIDLMEATVAVPLWRKPVRVGTELYTDTNIVPYLREHIEHALATDATDILIVYNGTFQRLRHYEDDNRTCEIPPDKNWKMGRFETDSQVMIENMRLMGRRIKQVFGDDTDISL